MDFVQEGQPQFIHCGSTARSGLDSQGDSPEILGIRQPRSVSYRTIGENETNETVAARAENVSFLLVTNIAGHPKLIYTKVSDEHDSRN